MLQCGELFYGYVSSVELLDSEQFARILV